MREVLAPVAAAHDTAREARSELSRVVARNFRNFHSVDVQVPPNGMVLLGENGQGKTNFLEAIRYFTVLRSARGALDSELVRHGEDAFYIAATSSENQSIAVGFDRTGKRKKVVLNGTEVQRMSDAFGSIMATMLSPGDVQLVSGGPSERRRFLDVLLSLVDARYLAALQRYRGALVRRNAALRTTAKHSHDHAQVAVWEPVLAEAGEFLWRRRAEWVARYTGELNQICEIIGERGQVQMDHIVHGATDGHLDADRLMLTMESQRDADVRRGRTNAGPHRDDLRISLKGRELNTYGSGGQQHTMSLALRLLETVTLHEQRGVWPVLLLDDPFAELDKRRAERILGFVAENSRCQVILAIPREDNIPREFTRLDIWDVLDGQLSRREPPP